MYRVILALLLVCSLAIVSANGEMLAPPPRPQEFTSATQLRKYLAALNEYYSIMGRPRFGKRSEAFHKNSYSPSEGAFAERTWPDFQQ